MEAQNPQILMKSRKNDTEADNLRKAHLKDGYPAHTRFMYWLKKNAGKIPMTERSAAAKLEEFRAQQEGYLGASFESLSVHLWRARRDRTLQCFRPETDAELQEGKLLLTRYRRTLLGRLHGYHENSGSGQREPGGKRRHFTIVGKSDAGAFANTVFLAWTQRSTVVFWKERLNFNHGTGHGVGYLMNIHEAPINFRWREGRTPAPVLEKNMVITDEPGVYIEDSHGIRLENELLVQEDEKNQYGQFMHFEILTFVPIDLDAVLPELMSVEERAMLNAYHAKVYELIGPRLPEEERKWLREYTRPV